MSRSNCLVVACLAAGVAIAGCAPSGPSSSPAPSTGAPASQAAVSTPAPTPRAVIIDTDLAGDDITALAILLRDPGVDIRAITVSGTGEVHCGPGLGNLGDLLDDFGARQIPFGCGRETAGPEAYPWPDEWRAGADAGYGLAFKPKPGMHPAGDAAEVIARAVADSPTPPLIVAWDPGQISPTPSPRTRRSRGGLRVCAMGGTLDAPGNTWADGARLTVTVEYNFGADPAAVAAVLGTSVQVTLVPLDATNDAPVPAGLVDKLAADHAAAGADLVYEMYARNPFLTGEGVFLWDSALIELTPGIDADFRTWTDAPRSGPGRATPRAGDPRPHREPADRRERRGRASGRCAARGARLTTAGTLAVTWRTGTPRHDRGRSRGHEITSGRQPRWRSRRRCPATQDVG